jgi:hypothetical protein
MRKVTRKEKLKFLQKWFDIFDDHFFDGYFKDKDITIGLEPCPDELHDPIVGYACYEDGEIVITDYCFESCTPFGIREALLHEMIHLFVAYTYPNGKRTWGDRCRDFVECERSFQRLRIERIEKRLKRR